MAIAGELQDLSKRMRDDWDQRILQDYRYWMSDGVEDDTAMWRVGERDFALLTEGLDPQAARTETVLEIGCGVGRLLRPAARLFKTVIGVDVSSEAIRRAEELLRGSPTVRLIQGNGCDLHEIASGSLDGAFSFAALTSMPVAAIANYFAELSRVLRAGGWFRAQLYLGPTQDTYAEDTLSIRSFAQERVEQAGRAAGFDLEYLKALELPIEISDPQRQITACVAGFRRNSRPPAASEEILELLIGAEERSAGVEWQGSPTEYAMAVYRAQQHLEAGRLSEARASLEFAVARYACPEREIIDLLEQMREHKNFSHDAPQGSEFSPLSAQFSSELFERNMTVIRERFPALHGKLCALPLGEVVSVRRSAAGEPVLAYRDLPLDQVDKPTRAAEVWAERALSSGRTAASTALAVVGCCGAYHLEALANRCTKTLHLVEGNLEILRACLGVRDLRTVFKRVQSISTTPEELEQAIGQEESKGCELLIYPQAQATERLFVDEVKRGFWAARGFGELRPSLAVIGPIYGGTLPIARYTAEGFRDLKQRVQLYDLAGFHKAYLEMEGFVKGKNRIGVLQSQYVEMLSQVVLEGITERPVDIVIALAQAPLSPRVLTELRNRGIITAMWFTEDCRRFTSWRDLAPYYDYMFLIQRGEHLENVERAGTGRALYLPMAFAPAFHRPLELTAEERKEWGSDLSFVGAGYNNRQQMFAVLAARDFKIWGTEWPTMAPFDRMVQLGGRRIAPEEYVKIFNATKVNLNLHSSMERDGVELNGDFINPRTFELAGCGAFQLVDHRLLLEENFAAGSEVATFGTRPEMLEKIDYYLARPAERTAMAERARCRALAEHSYEKRLRMMLGAIYADRFEQLRSRLGAGPWPQTLEGAEEFPELRKRLQLLYDRGEDPTLAALVAEIRDGKGALTETEKRLLFLFHVKSQISYVNELREGKTK